MPVKSSRQFGAMAAAAHGSSRHGIPKKVAKEFLSKTSQTQKSAFAKALARRGKK